MLDFVNLRIRWRRTLLASALAFGSVLAGTYFLIENVRAGGAVLVATIVALAAYLALNAPNPSGQRGICLRVRVNSSCIARLSPAAGRGLTGFIDSVRIRSGG